MKKILIFYGSYGGGHLSAANNIKDYIEANDKNCEIIIVDCVEYISKIINRITTTAYSEFSRHAHWLWKKIYDSSESGFMSSFSNIFNKKMSKKLNKLIQEFSPDLIISTHPFSSQMCAILKQKGEINCLIATIMTDYVEHNQWFILHEYIDYYFVAHDGMKQSLIQKGVKADKILASGIPFSNRFLEEFDRNSIFKEYHLRPDKKTILFFGGGAFGFGKKKLAVILKTIIDNFPDLQVIAISGKNPKIKKYFDDIVKEHKCDDYVKILSFTKEVPKLMYISDLVITKPGGLTTTESLVSSLPMIIINPIPGQEEENATYVLENGAGIWLKKGDHIETILDNILSSPDTLLEMTNKAKSLAKRNATKDICTTLLNAIQEEITI